MDTILKKIRSYELENVSFVFISAFLGLFLAFIIKTELRYAIYLVTFSYAVFLFLFINSPTIKVSIVLFILFFIERVIIHNRLFTDYFLVSISLVFSMLVIATVYKNYTRLNSVVFQKYIWIVFITISFISIFMNGMPENEYLKTQIQVFQLHYIEYFIFFLVGFLAFNTAKDVDQFLKVFILFCGVVAVAHIFSILTGINLEALRGNEAVAQIDLSLAKNWRYGGFFGNPNYMGALYVMVIPGCLMVLSDKKSFFYKTMAASVLAAVIISLSMSGSRGGVLFSLLNSSLVLLFYVKGGWKRMIFIAFICVFLFTTYLAVDLYFYEQVQRSFARIGEKDFTEDVRWSIWRGAVLIALNNPGGIGLGGENFAGWLHHYSGYYFEHAHNAFLSIAAHNGILGLVFFLSLIWTQLARLVSTMKSLPNEKRFVSAFVLSVITGYLLSSMTNGTFINNIKINHFFALFLGVCAFLNYEATEQTSDTLPVGANRHEI